MDNVYSKTRWRLIRTSPASGAWNMALDEALFESAIAGQTEPVLRLYAWDPPCLSLGFSQPASDANLTALTERGWQLVRRPTGGRAILHTDELTYSVIGRQDDPRLSGSILESYQKISAALLAALRLLGLPAQSLPDKIVHPDSDPKGPVCFEVPSNYEITVHERKLIGSAQARRKDCILQHGSLPLYGDLGRIIQVLSFTGNQEASNARSQALERLARRATTVEAELAHRIMWEQAAQAFEQAFREELNLDLLLESPRQEELKRANQRVESKYSQDSWNLRL